MKRAQMKKYICSGNAGMTLVEVIISLALMVLLFSVFAVFIQGATAMNKRTILADTALSKANNAVLMDMAGEPDTVTITIDGMDYEINVTRYAGTGDDVTLWRFEP
ncbi:MAG: type II secretion system protein [Clostridia bacterium]